MIGLGGIVSIPAQECPSLASYLDRGQVEPIAVQLPSLASPLATASVTSPSPSYSSSPSTFFFTNLERQGLCLVFPPDGQMQTALVQPGHLVVLLPDASLDLIHDRRHAVVGQARVRAAQASHLEILTSDC